MANKNEPAKIRIERVSIENYKGIDSLKLEFPDPLMKGDPDILVMGSENGLGKTSVLECCSLLLLALFLDEGFEKLFDDSIDSSNINLYDLLVRSEQSSLEISADIHLGSGLFNVTLSIQRRGTMAIKTTMLNQETSQEEIRKLINKQNLFDNDIKFSKRRLLFSVFGLSANPLVTAPVLLFHSYRKIQEENPDLGVMVRGDLRMRRTSARKYGYLPSDDNVISIFKMVILRSLMSGAKLFELEDKQNSGGAITTLNNLIKEYAGGVIGKLRPSSDNTLDFRIKHGNKDDKNTFSFDGLSSGQKEIISTLFLIWYQTRNSPSVVFIDEPELHLNAQWHSKFIKNLIEIAPANQYIVATHSEYVMDSVDRQHRVQLERD